MRAVRRDLVSKAWSYLADDHRTMVTLAVLAVLAAQAESTALVLIALMAEGVANGTDLLNVSAGPINLSLPVTDAGIATTVAIAVAAIVSYIYGRLLAIVSARLEREGRDEIVTAFARASWEYQASQKSSHIQGLLLRLMDARGVAFSSLVRWVRAFATIAVFITVAALMSIWGAVTIVMFGGLLSLAVLPIRRKVGHLGKKAADQEVAVAVDFAEAIDHGADVRVFGAWGAFVGKYSARSSNLEGIRSHLHIIRGLMPVVYQYGALTLILVMMLVAARTSTTGEFGQFAASALLLLRSIQYGQQLQLSLQNLAESIPRIELLDRAVSTPSPKIIPGDIELASLEQMELRNMSYTYPEAEGPALRKLSLRFTPGSIYGIAGPSGSGKSTLAQILLRLRWRDSGEYLVNGQSADIYSQKSWNALVSHVPQNPRLLHGTLLENVTFLDETIGREEVVEALRKVGLVELIEALPGGLDAQVGPTDRNLSVGQVQRLGIARALVRNPQLVILDEPTSALDVDAERVVGEALNALRNRPDVVVVVIAHRPSTLALCDELVVLQDGQIVATGKAEDITRQSGFLSRTWGSENGESSSNTEHPSSDG